MGIRIFNLNKSFGEKVIFDNFSYDFPERGIIKIVGQSGIGKTTLLRIISGIDKNYSGLVESNSSVSYAFQEHRLLPLLNAIDNIFVAAFPKPTDDGFKKARAMLKRLRFADDDMLLKPAKMSGGMKQRVSLARAFLRDSDVLILDEPTKELDREISAEVLKLVIEASRDRLVILVTHDALFDSVDVADTIKIG